MDETRQKAELDAEHTDESDAKKGKLENSNKTNAASETNDNPVIATQNCGTEAHGAKSEVIESSVLKADTQVSNRSAPDGHNISNGDENRIVSTGTAADLTNSNTGCTSINAQPHQDASTLIETNTSTTESKANAISEGQEIAFKLVFSKQLFDMVAFSNTQIRELRLQISELTGVPPANQKLNFRANILRDEQTVGDVGITRNAKLMLIGSRPAEIDSVAVSRTAVQSEKDDISTNASGATSLSKQDVHKRVLEKYPKPDDAAPGYRNVAHSLPGVPLTGMLNKRGAKVRLTFKLELDEVWIGTNERTEKVPMHSIRSIVHEPIVGSEEYSIVGLQLGPTELSRYWLYWVPSQYVRAIRDTILKP